MKTGIMQPYLFPYIGYFQLIHAVDQFVIYDDVQYIKSGWINRNRILVNQKDFMFTLSLKKASSSLNINERYFSKNFGRERDRFLKTLKECYGQMDDYENVSTLLENALGSVGEHENVSHIITNSIKLICDYLDIDTQILLSSEIEKENRLTGEQKVIEINKSLGSTHYINPVGGKELYSKEAFRKHHLMLNFLKSRPIQYRQKNVTEFIPSLSIIDVLMFNSKKKVKQFLNEYDLV